VGGDRYRFGEFEFEPASGELRPVSGEGDGNAQRLAPQPAKLLAMLAGRGGDLVTREEIRETIWPGVQVDFDASLHFCVSQVRAALGDTAQAPRYVQTLPRRGYRLIPPVEQRSSPTGTNGAAAGPRRGWLMLAVGVLIALAAGLLLRGGTSPNGSAAEPAAAGPARDAIRVGILPFEAPSSSADSFPDTGSIAEWVLQRLDERGGDRLAIIGPTSTTAYASGPLHRLTEDYDLAWIINGRFLTGAEGPRMLGEVIRASDGAHVWVRAYTDLADERSVGEDIADGALSVLGIDGRRDP